MFTYYFDLGTKNLMTRCDFSRTTKNLIVETSCDLSDTPTQIKVILPPRLLVKAMPAKPITNGFVNLMERVVMVFPITALWGHAAAVQGTKTRWEDAD